MRDGDDRSPGELREDASGGRVGAEDRQSIAETRRSYERIPYQSSPWTSCQPARLETIAKLHDLPAADPDRCRVLEIGCGDGGNLIPLAVAHPGSRFVGVDLASVHIDTARHAVEEIALDNIAFEAASFLDWGAGHARFDYVIAHGLASWVTPALQDALLETFERTLAENGVVFVSYNTHPGWAMQHAIRELMRHHNRGITDVEKAVDHSRRLLDLLVETVPGRESAYREHLESIRAVALDSRRRHYFAHEYLEDENNPFYVRDFIERAAMRGLAYLGDADLVDSELDNMPDEPRARVSEAASDRVSRIQMLDYVVNRKFRQSLLCHASAAPDTEIDWTRVCEMFVASPLRTEDDPRLVVTADVMRFSDRHGRTIELDQPLAKAALMRFVEVSPQPIAFVELVEWARQRADEPAPPDEDAAAEQRLLVGLVFGRLFSAGMAEVQASPPCWATEVGDRPVASPLARHAARDGSPTASLRHTTVALDNEDVCAVLALLDGSRGRAEIIRMLEGRVEEEAIGTILDLAARNALLRP